MKTLILSPRGFLTIPFYLQSRTLALVIIQMLRDEPDPVRRETLKFHLLQEYLPPYYLCGAFCSSVTCKFIYTTS